MAQNKVAEPYGGGAAGGGGGDGVAANGNWNCSSAYECLYVYSVYIDADVLCLPAQPTIRPSIHPVEEQSVPLTSIGREGVWC